LFGDKAIAVIVLVPDNSGIQELHKKVQGVALLFYIRANEKTQIGVSLNEHTLDLPVSTEWQKYTVIYDSPTNIIRIQFSDFPINNNIYIKDIVLIDR